MAQPIIQTSFAAGELAPKLRARVDIAKYRAGAALMRNFYVDFAGGGASTRQGTKFVNYAKLNLPRLIAFQSSVSISYVLEFGDHYIRFHQNGAPVLEAPVAIQSITGSPVTVNSTSNGYNNGDDLIINGQTYVVTNATTNTYQLNSFYSQTPVLSLSATQAQRIYTITSPYSESDLFPNQGTANPGLKWVQDVTSMIITHPSYPPQILTLIAPTNWTLTTIIFGPLLQAPTSPVLTPNITGTGWYYSYIVTSVDNNGQESDASQPATATNVGNINTVNPSNLVITWSAVPGAVSYNVYKASPSYNAAVPVGSQFGFVSNVTGTSYQESYPGILPDFSQTPPIVTSPITGGNVLTINLTGNATYSVVPTVTIPSPSSGFQATAYASLAITGLSIVSGVQGIIATVSTGPVGLSLIFSNNITATITGAVFSGVGTNWNITAIGVTNFGSLTGAGAAVPANPISPFALSGTTINGQPASAYQINYPGHTPTFNVASWDIGSLVLIQGGFGYTSAPTPTFSPVGASATTTVSQISQSGGSGSASPVGNPRVCGFYQERLVLASPNAGLQSFYMSQPGSFFNFNVSNPTQADDAIFGSIISEELNDIRSLLNVSTGLLALTGGGAWLINGGGGISTANPITPSNVSATPQAFNGANDIRPLKINFDVLFVTNKGNYVRSASYNIYANNFIGADISTLSNHLFFNYQINDWTWAEEPYKVGWLVRSDGQLISMTYVKEQELIGWAHHDTQGAFTSTCSVIETNIGGPAEPNTVDATYFVVTRTLGNGGVFSTIERMADRYFTYGAEDAWSLDCALQTAPIVTDQNVNIFGGVNVLGGTVTISLLGPTGWFSPPVASFNWIFRCQGGIYKIVSYISATEVTAIVLQVARELNPIGNSVFALDYTLWEPVTTVTAPHLANMVVQGVADGVPFGPVTADLNGTVTLANFATKVTMGLAYTPQLQTLPLDTGEPTIQSKRKKVPAATLRVADTLGLQIGTTFANVVTFKDFQLGAIPSQSNGPVTVAGLVNGDGRQILDQVWQEVGQLCIQQNLPYPATVLGVMPELEVGDSMGERNQR